MAATDVELPEHDKGVTGVAFSADGRWALTLDAHGKLKVSDTATGAVKHELQLDGINRSPLAPHPRLAVSRQGTLAAAGAGNGVTIYDFATGEVKQRIQHKGSGGFRLMRFNQTGDLLVSLDYRGVTVWSIPAGEVVQSFELPSRTWDDITLLPDGKTLVCGGKDKTLDFYDLRSGKLTESLKITQGSVRCAAANHDGTLLAVADTAENLVLYDLQARRVRIAKDKESCYFLAFSSDGLLAAGYYDVEFFEVGEKELKPIGRCDVRGPGSTMEMEFSPDGKRFIVTDDMQHQADYYRLERSQEERTVVTVADKFIAALASSRDGKWLAWADYQTLSLRSTVDGKTTTVPLNYGGYVGDRRLEFSPDGSRLVLCDRVSNASSAYVFAVPSLELQRSWGPGRGQCTEVCFVPDGKSLLLFANFDASRWDLATDKTAEQEPKVQGARGRLVPGAQDRIFTFDERSQLRIYSWPKAELLKEWHAGHDIRGLAVSPDGALAASYHPGDKRVLVWNAERGDLAYELDVDPQGVLSAVFSSDGRWLLTSGRDLRLRVWSSADGQPRLSCPAHAKDCDEIVFVPGTSRFYTRGDPHYGVASIKEWDLTKLLERIPPPPMSKAKPETPPFTGGQFVSDFGTCDDGPAGFFDQGRKIFGLDGYEDLDLTVYDAVTYAELWKQKIGKAEWVEFSADGRWWASSYGIDYGAFEKNPSLTATVKIWDAATRQVHQTLKLDSPSVSRLCFSPDGRTLAVAAGTVGVDSRGEVTLWDVAAGTRIKKLPVDEPRMTHVQFSPDGSLLAYGGFKSHLNLWDLKADQLRYQRELKEYVKDLRFSPDGKYVAACGGDNGRGTVDVFDTATGAPQSWLAGLKDQAQALAFSPQGNLLVVSCINERRELSYRFFHLPDGKEVRRLAYETSRGYDGVIVFNGDGSRFIENTFGYLKLWRLDHLFNEPLQRDLQRLKDRNLWIKYRDDELLIEFPYNEANDRELKNLPVIPVPFVLNIRSDGVTDAGIAHLAKQKNLIGLDLDNCEKLTTTSLKHLKGLPLRSLTAPDCKLADDAAVAALGELTTLEKLTAATSYDRLESLNLAPLAKLKQLRELRFETFTAPGESLRHLADLELLEVLSFRSSEFKDEDLRHLAKLKKLRTVELQSDYQFTGAGLKHLAGSVGLEVLDLESCGRVDDAGIAVVSGFKRLRELVLRGTAVTDAGLPAVAGLTELERFELPDNLTDAGLAHLAGLTKLRTLALYQEAITDRGLQHLSKLTALEELKFGELEHVTGSGLAAFAGATKLKELQLRMKGLTDDGLQGVAKLTQLESLSLPSQLGAAGLKHLTTLTNLTELNLSYTQLTDADLAPLAKLTNLKTLRFEKVPLTDAAIPYLVAVKKLSHLSIDGTKITPAGKKRLETSFPKDNYIYVSEP